MLVVKNVTVKFSLFLLISSLILINSSANALTTSRGIREDIGRQIDGAKLGKHDIIIDASNGEVTLSGEVASESDREIVGELSRATAGVDTVTNNLKVVAPPALSADARGRLNLEEFPSDENITTDVKRAISSIGLKDGKNIEVATKDRVVSFKGSLANHREIDHVLAVSLMVDGVKDIDSQMLIGKRAYTTVK